MRPLRTGVAAIPLAIGIAGSGTDNRRRSSLSRSAKVAECEPRSSPNCRRRECHVRDGYAGFAGQRVSSAAARAAPARRTGDSAPRSRAAGAGADSEFRPSQHVARLPAPAVRGGAGRRRATHRDSRLSAGDAVSRSCSGRIGLSMPIWTRCSPSARRLQTDAVLARVGDRAIRRGEVLRISLVHGVDALSLNELVWRMEELDATRRFAA
ncbi:MAG: hypothetical protein MZV63_19460 [Marinilabiliales bacterium]|nr:hypothetical protein [Marinilabiliales bacterium]